MAMSKNAVLPALHPLRIAAIDRVIARARDMERMVAAASNKRVASRTRRERVHEQISETGSH
jgi:hypothetical protein